MAQSSDTENGPATQRALDKVIAVATSDDEILTTEMYTRLLHLAAVVDPLNPDPADLVQEAIARTLRRGHLTELHGPEAYLARVIIRLASNRRRHILRSARAIERVCDELRVNGCSSNDYSSDALGDLVSLKPSERAILYLRVVEGRNFSEIGQILGLKEVAARQRASRAMNRLRSHFDSE
ncbi:MAG: sigma-70 family RNA polymerase sigma factor [Acidimicrobiales bacterium]